MRWLRLLDPAEAGFARRAKRAAVLGLALLLLLGCGIANWLVGPQLGSPRFWIGVAQVELGYLEAAERSARSVIARDPFGAYAPYRLLGTALRRQGRIEEQLEVYDLAGERFPGHWQAQGHLCRYRMLFADPASSLAACDIAVEIAPDERAEIVQWRGMARAQVGDLAGAAEDMAEAADRWDAEGRLPTEVLRMRDWAVRLEAGENPVDEDVLERERGRF